MKIDDGSINGDKKIEIESQLKNLKVVCIFYIIVCAVHGLVDIINLLIIRGNFDLPEDYSSSYQPCKMFTGNFTGDAICYFIYWWVVWCFWCYSFLFTIWEKVKKPDIQN